MTRVTRRVGWLAAIIVVLLAAACGADEEETAVCKGMRLERDTAAPMEWVDLTLGDTEETNISARIFADGFDPFPTSVAVGEDGSLSLLAPVHPAGLQGGTVDVELSGDEMSCPKTTLTIEPMAEAPGAFPSLVDKIARIVELEAQHLGVTRQELIDTLDTDYVKPSPPVNVLALAKAQFLLDHPSNPNSLTRVANGDAPMLDEMGVSADYRLFNAIIAQSGLLDAYDEHIARLEQLPPGNYQWTQPNTGSGLSPTSQTDAPLKIAIGSAAELSAAMTAGDLSCRMINNESLKRINSFVGLGTAVPQGYAQAFGVGYSTMMTVLLEVDRAKCGLFPNQLTNFVTGVDSLDLEEDRPQLSLDPMTVDAKSEGWDVGETALEVVYQAVSVLLADFKGSKAALTAKSTTVTQEAAEEYMKNIVGSTALKGSKKANQAINDRYGGATLGPYQWSGITLDTSDYVGIDAEFLRQLEGPLAVAPRKIGKGPVVIAALASKFPPTGARVLIPGSVNPIEIEMLQRILVNPGETKEIYFKVKNAFNPKLQWSNNAQQPGPIGVVSGTTTTDVPVGKVRFATPSDRGRYPVTVTAESLSTTGLRHPDNDPEPLLQRSFLYDKDVEISPRYVCLPPGESHEFSAKTAQDNPTIEWFPAAQIDKQDDRTVTYTAPSARGTYEVRVEATYVNEDGDTVTAEDRATVRVDDCKCWWALDLIGSASASGRYGTFTSMTNFSYDMMLMSDEGGPTQMNLYALFPSEEQGEELEGPGPPDQQGSYYAQLTPSPLLGPYGLAPPDQSVAFIESFDGDYVQGSSYGLVLDYSDTTYVPYELQFRVAYMPPDISAMDQFERMDRLCPEAE